MEIQEDSGPNRQRVAGCFETTHWSAVFDAGQRDCIRVREALERLCLQYWQPLYGFARRKGYGEADAEDLTQSFFCHFIRKSLVQIADPARGRFRTFLLTAFDRFIIGEWKKSLALKRNGASVDPALSAEAQVEINGAEATEFDRAWAEQVFGDALARLRREYFEADQANHFLWLRKYLSQNGNREAYTQAAAELGMKPESVNVAVHRLRRRYAELVRAEVSRTVTSPVELDAELRYLVDLMAR